MSDAVDRRLDELWRRSQPLVPRAGFQARVLAAVFNRPTLAAELGRVGRWFVPLALGTALVVLGVASRAGSVSSVDLVVSEARWELEF